MIETKRKTLQDFPRFIVASMLKQPADAQGFIYFELEGKFDQAIQRTEITWFWLLSEGNSSFCTQWKSQDDVTFTSVLTGFQENVPDASGTTLYYLGPRWRPYHVWMVLDSEWGWRKVQFEASDALAEDFESHSASIINGREVRKWTKLEKADKTSHASRHYPAKDGDPVPIPESLRLVSGGWDHEHCELCNGHIDPGIFAHQDPYHRWVCEKCYEKYVERRDLSFVDEL